ncbi:MAG: TPM domain-containing protein, partial [Actinomycetota bacterium]|nr:TPM domain-containing protein [Actinomycetota bacterium]
MLAVLAGLVVLAGAAGPGSVRAAQDVPAFTSLVVDAAGVVPDDVEAQVRAGLTDYQARSGNQVAVAVVRTTGGRSLEDYSIDLARAWGVGERGSDNGVLLLIAFADRRLRIEVGRGLEGQLTDLESGRIVRQRMLPLLRAGDVGGAVAQGTQAIRQALGDEAAGELPPPPQPSDAPDGPSGFPYGVLVVPLMFGFIAWRVRRYGWHGGGPIYVGGGWSSGWGGGGFGGG